jgi:hypothetical protein
MSPAQPPGAVLDLEGFGVDGFAADAAEAQGDALCAMCQHEMRVHDAIGLRYCRATQSQALTRGCVCQVDASDRHRAQGILTHISGR